MALAQGGGALSEVARTFGVDWPHLLAQTVSFSNDNTVIANASLKRSMYAITCDSPSGSRMPS